MITMFINSFGSDNQLPSSEHPFQCVYLIDQKSWSYDVQIAKLFHNHTTRTDILGSNSVY
jgi:hypothetical protein